MDYIEPAEARGMPGLRLALTMNVPGPWSESAKAIFRFKGIDYVPVAQRAAAPNPDLVAWTGIRNAPIAVYEDQPPRTNYLDILALAERLKPEPRLIPEDIADRILCLGISSEICADGGFGWSRRLLMQKRRASLPTPPVNLSGLDHSVMAKAYGAPAHEMDAAAPRVAQILDFLAAQLEMQRARGSDYFVGDSVTAADIHWACFSGMLEPLPHDVNPMPDWMRASYVALDPLVEQHKHPILLEHRDRMFERHLGLPLDY